MNEADGQSGKRRHGNGHRANGGNLRPEMPPDQQVSSDEAKAPDTVCRAMVSFDFRGARVRTLDKAGHTWFVAADICDALDIANSRDALARLRDDEKGVGITDTLGGPQEMNVVNESGVYALAFRSRKPEAEEFRYWVTNEVIPAIRKTGRYDGESEKAERRPAGRYVEIVLPDGRSYRYQTPIYSGALQEFNEADAAILAHQLAVIAILWARTEQFRAFDLEVKGRMLTQLRAAIENGNRMASEYLEWFQEAKLTERNID